MYSIMQWHFFYKTLKPYCSSLSAVSTLLTAFLALLSPKKNLIHKPNTKINNDSKT